MGHSVESRDGAQAFVLAFLAAPGTLGPGAATRIDTHAASVFLGPDRVLKVKRAVRFPFLDFSTPELRRRACEAELAANAPFSPQLYRGITAIVRRPDGTLALGDGTQGEVVDWAVDMVRFDERATLDRLADRGLLDPALADRLARRVAEAHARAPIADGGPWLARLARIIEENQTELAAAPDVFPPQDVADLGRAAGDAFARVRDLLAARDRLGFVRRGHGDLHLGNIVLIDGEPVLFDALEFDPALATGDLLYDLAFLLMDLVRRGLGPAANIVLNRWLDTTGEPAHLEGLAALPLFIALRAGIRAKVTAALIERRPQEAARLAVTARDCLRLAREALGEATPALVAVGGLSGTGKSLLARALAPDLPPMPGSVVLRSDVIRKQLLGYPETAPLPAEAYRPEVTARVYAVLAERARAVVAAGHSCIVDAVFGLPAERHGIEAIAAACEVPFHGLFLTADLATRVARVSARTNDASDADAAVAALQESFDLGAMDWAGVDASGSPEATLAAARQMLGRP